MYPVQYLKKNEENYYLVPFMIHQLEAEAGVLVLVLSWLTNI